jgi:hypothetical protein
VAVLCACTGQKGDKGDPGENGQQGPPGVNGAPGAPGAGNLVLELRLDETAGSNFADSSPFALTATAPASGVAVGSTGHSRQAVNFSGGLLTISAGLRDNAQVWVEAWIQPQAPLNTTRVILTEVGRWAFKQVNTELALEVTGAASTAPCVVTSSGVGLTAGTWYHVAGWYDGLRVTVAVNGKPQRTAICPNGPLVESSGPFHVGGIQSGASVTEPYAGTIDEIRVRGTAPGIHDQPGATYVQWGTSSCTGAGAETLYAGFAFTNHHTHSGSGEALCLRSGVASGAAQGYVGDLAYALSIEGGAVHQGVIQNSRRVQCSYCASHRTSCFRLDGASTCPAGYATLYTGYMYGSHYTHAAPYNRLCVDHLNFDNSLANSPNSGAHIYPTRVHDPANTGVPANNGISCAVCCTDD